MRRGVLIVHKPLLLLVDDDSAVLEALEAELSPVFAQIARIETFQDPRDVLAAMPEFETQRRQVAVAVIDQKMAHCAGLDLLKQLREVASRPVAQHMSAILLTGYGGLDTALDAKNEAAVDRYLEKPWDSTALVNNVRASFAAYMARSGVAQHVVFRELRDETEVRAHLALRYQVFRRSPTTAQFLPVEDVQFDVDAYDGVSRLFGVFVHDVGGQRLVGGLRVVDQEPSPAREVLDAVFTDLPTLRERLNAERAEPLPLLNYLVHRDAVRAVLARLSARGERVVEPSRLAVNPTVARKICGGGGLLGTHIIESAVAFYFFFLGVENALLACVPHHARFYEPLGFRETEGTQTTWHAFTNSDVTCLHGTQTGVPHSLRATMGALSGRIERTGASCRCAAFPSCVPTPYHTGDFSSADVFCPVAAVGLVTRGVGDEALKRAAPP